ncbi:MAG: sialidase family protein [Armatimonadota bacterium]
MKLNEIKFQDAATRTYMGSPSIIRLDNGDLLAVHDYFGTDSPRNFNGEYMLTSVYRSNDDGQTWINVRHIAHAFWSSLFKHNGSVYLIGISEQWGSIVIRRSDDNGNTWTHPADSKSGLLFKGSIDHSGPNYHCAPMPVFNWKGRLYRAFEDCTPLIWGPGFKSAVISIDENADLLDANNWVMSNKLPYDPSWTPAGWESEAPGWLEGNVLEAPNGELWNILRFNSKPTTDKAAIVKIHDEGRRVTFDPKTGFIDFPGGMSKFTIRRDPVTGIYLTFTNNNTDRKWPNQRNILSLYKSDDLLHWIHVSTLMKDDDNLSYDESMRLTGFQYVDWHFDGDDIIYIVRTAYKVAANYHDSNRIVFCKLDDYRSLI